ncbi:MAG: aminopeptidase [Lachnospiraceae bacterium]|nr:aminopeptidase [Lachnospiraceae bacterium]
MEESIKQTERWTLAVERVSEIAEDPEAEGAAGEYFQRTAAFLKMMLRTLERIEAGELTRASVEELADWNRELYEDIVGDAYAHSFANPDYAVSRLGKECGQILSFVCAELRGTIVYAFEGRLTEFLICMELFLQLHAELEEGQLPPAEQLRDDVYWFVSDYCDVTVTARVREQVDPSLSFARDIIMEADLQDPRYLYRFGEYVGDTELRMSAFLNTLPEEEIVRIASVFTEGYRIGFEVTGKDLSRKKTVNIRYCLGFERIIREAVKNFAAMGLESILYRAAVSRVNMRETNKVGYYGTSPNRQYDYDHKGDAALFMDSAFVERRTGALRTAFEEYRDLARGHAGPAVMEIFGETPFVPQVKESALKLDEKQQKNQVRANSLAAQITNEYIPGEERSFTIIAFPVPDIGAQFEDIFRETVRINTLDYRTYQRIQQRIIDALDTGYAVHILGSGENRTDLTVALAKLRDPQKETIFENCVADVNIPVGEVFTSPVLEGTNGVLHVSGVYLNGLLYQDLELHFQDGMVSDYRCGNYEDEEENRRYIRENVLYHHDTLPMGEFAIGTNTTAYVAARRYHIEARMPILIAEKTGPHFALGDTCYSWEEDTPTFNPDGKQIIAKENACSALRQEDPEKAYFNCHTDITIPYDELQEIAVVCRDGSRIPIIREGRFVLPGTEELNEALDNEVF